MVRRFSTGIRCINQEMPSNPEAPAIPTSAADAWAAVYIDVAEKLDAEQQLGGEGVDQALTAEAAPIDGRSSGAAAPSDA